MNPPPSSRHLFCPIRRKAHRQTKAHTQTEFRGLEDPNIELQDQIIMVQWVFFWPMISTLVKKRINQVAAIPSSHSIVLYCAALWCSSRYLSNVTHILDLITIQTARSKHPMEIFSSNASLIFLPINWIYILWSSASSPRETYPACSLCRWTASNWSIIAVWKYLHNFGFQITLPKIIPSLKFNFPALEIH